MNRSVRTVAASDLLIILILYNRQPGRSYPDHIGIQKTNRMSYVMKNGELYEGDTLNQVWPVERQLPPFWWWAGGPAPWTAPEH